MQVVHLPQRAGWGPLGSEDFVCPPCELCWLGSAAGKERSEGAEERRHVMQRDITIVRSDLLSLLTTASCTSGLLIMSSLEDLEERLQIFSSAHCFLHCPCLPYNLDF